VCLRRDLPCSIVRLSLPACVELLSQLLEDAALELQTAAFGGELLLGRLDRGGSPDEVVGRPGNLRTRRLELPLSGPEARRGGLQLLLPPSEARFGLLDRELPRADRSFALLDLPLPWHQGNQALLD